MDIKMYSFPQLKPEAAVEVEHFVYQLERKYREGVIDEVELTWMDQANTWLLMLDEYA
jgi:hypothetical protein